MNTKVTFRNMKSNQELIGAANEAAKKFEKFADEILSIDFIFRNDVNAEVEITLKVKKDVLVIKEESEDFKKSLNEASDKMVRQIRKWKQKLINKN